MYNADKPVYVRLALPSADEQEWKNFDNALYKEDKRGFIPYRGETIWSTDVGNFKVGDGVTRWIELPYYSNGGGGGGSLPNDVIFDCGDASDYIID